MAATNASRTAAAARQAAPEATGTALPPSPQGLESMVASTPDGPATLALPPAPGDDMGLDAGGDDIRNFSVPDLAGASDRSARLRAIGITEEQARAAAALPPEWTGAAMPLPGPSPETAPANAPAGTVLSPSPAAGHAPMSFAPGYIAPPPPAPHTVPRDQLVRELIAAARRVMIEGMTDSNLRNRIDRLDQHDAWHVAQAANRVAAAADERGRQAAGG